MKILRTSRFKKAWQQLTDSEKRLSGKAIMHLTSNIKYPALQVKKIKSTSDIWEARASLSLRITFQIENELIILRNIGRHDETLKHP